MKMRGLVRRHPCFKRYLSEGDICYSFLKTGKITEHTVREVIDYSKKVRRLGWREGCVYYFVEGIPNESAVGEEIYLTKKQAKLAHKKFIAEWLKGIW